MKYVRRFVIRYVISYVIMCGRACVCNYVCVCVYVCMHHIIACAPQGYQENSIQCDTWVLLKYSPMPAFSERTDGYG